MSRTFIYSFTPPSLDPAPGATIELDVSEIENAGIREVLQTPGAAYGAWSILDALLSPTGIGTPFIFKQPLGQAREVKVALSGLFGRFVARAYLERYFDLSIFAHLGNRVVDLDRRKRAKMGKDGEVEVALEIGACDEPAEQARQCDLHLTSLP